MFFEVFVYDNKERDPHDTAVPVYDIQTDKKTWIECNTSFLHVLDVMRAEENFVNIDISKKEGNMLDKLKEACSDLADFEKKSRGQFYNLIAENCLKDIMEYLNVKNDYMFSIQTDEFREVIKKAKAVKKKLKSILEKKDRKQAKKSA